MSLGQLFAHYHLTKQPVALVQIPLQVYEGQQIKFNCQAIFGKQIITGTSKINWSPGTNLTS